MPPETIELEDVSFIVRLPSETNRKYQRALAYRLVEFDQDEQGFKRRENISYAELLDAQIDAFLETSVLQVVGLDFDPKTFRELWPDAAADLWAEANALITEDSQKDIDALGKRGPSSAGVESGLLAQPA